MRIITKPDKIGLIIGVSLFIFLCRPFIFSAGVVQDEGYYLGKCWVSSIMGERPVFSDYTCKLGEKTSVERKILFFSTISQDLPPQYSIKILDFIIPIHGWLHTGPVPYIIQNIFLYIANGISSEKILGGNSIQREDIRFMFSKLPSIISGLITLFFIYFIAREMKISKSLAVIFTSTLLIFVYNSSIGISSVYLVSICFSSVAMYFFLKGRYGLFMLFSTLQILSYLPTFVFTISLVVGFLPKLREKVKVILHFSISLVLGFSVYILSSIDVETNPNTPPPWLGILPRSPLGSLVFMNNDIFLGGGFHEKTRWFIKDIVNFFGYKGSGNSFIIKEDYHPTIIYSIPFLSIFLICIAATPKKKKKKNSFPEWKKNFPQDRVLPLTQVILSITTFFVLQFFLFPFPNHPRRFFYVLPLISLVPSLAFKITKTNIGRSTVIFIIIIHIAGQIHLLKQAVEKLNNGGRFHISTKYEYQLELAKYIQMEGENSFVNISAYFNFPIMLGKNSEVPDYIYLLSPYYFYAKGDFVDMMKKVISIHKGNKFILQRGEEELKLVRKSAELEGMRMKVVRKIPEAKPIYYIVEFLPEK